MTVSTLRFATQTDSPLSAFERRVLDAIDAHVCGLDESAAAMAVSGGTGLWRLDFSEADAPLDERFDAAKAVRSTAASCAPRPSQPTAQTATAQRDGEPDDSADEMPVEAADLSTAQPEGEPDGDTHEASVNVAGLFEELRRLEAESARIELRRTEILAELISAQAAADLAAEPDAGPGRRREAAEQARATVIDSAVASCGGRRGPWQARAGLATSGDGVAAPLRTAVAAGDLSYDQACAVISEVEALRVPTDSQVEIAAAVAGYAARRRERTGAPAGQSEFRACLRRQAIKHAGTTSRRKAAHDQRAVWLRADEDGVAVLGVRGADARCVGAYRRVDAIARALRGSGDPRTLSQLRCDVALDLLLIGRPAPGAVTCTDNPSDPSAGWPTAVVNVVISAAALLGATDEPGVVEDTCVAAHTIRQLAHAAGSRWRRIVTDPVTGYAMEAVVRSYRPPKRMADAVRARDGRCRAPGCNRPAHTTDLDHVREHHRGGPTSGVNLQALCQLHHTKKTRHHWAASIARDGTAQWRLPDGRTYATFPFDYTDIGVESADTPATDSDSATDAVNPAAGEPAPCPDPGPDDGHDPLDEWLSNRDAALTTEIDRLRAELETERRTSGGWRTAFEQVRDANPPF